MLLLGTSKDIPSSYALLSTQLLSSVDSESQERCSINHPGIF